MKKVGTLLFFLVACILLALWSPWIGWNLDLSRLIGVEKPDSIASLQVFSLSGEIEVLIDGVVVGNANVENSPYIIDRVNPGERLLTLRKQSDIKNSYWSFSKLLNFIEGTSVAVTFNLGPEELFSEGHIVYAVEKKDKNSDSTVNINVSAENATVLLDNIAAQQITSKTFTERLNFDSQHKVSISKKGFENLEFTILPDSQEDRNRLKDFNINIEAYLLTQPVEVETK